jgi:glycosyltransferase involved in cell wall biosynthesis
VTHLVCPTQFGVDELVAGGYEGPASVIPYGVDRTIFHPGEPSARARVGIPEAAREGFIIGRADRNAVRKRYDLTMEAFALFAKEAPDAWLYCHCKPNEAWNLPQLARYYGVERRVIFTSEDLEPGAGVPVRFLADIYRSWAQRGVHLSTAHGEGFGLVALESAACGVPQVVVDRAAYGEWLRGHAWMLPVRSTYATAGGINTLGGVTSPVDVAQALHELYTQPQTLANFQASALAVAARPAYDWSQIAHTMLALWEEVVCG